MPVVSIRMDEYSHARLKKAAERISDSMSALAERLIDEGLRMERHPGIYFRGGATGRRPELIGGPEVIDVVGAIVGGDVPVDERIPRAADLLNLSHAKVEAAMAYYAEFSDEVDLRLREREEAAEEGRSAWERQQAALSR